MKLENIIEVLEQIAPQADAQDWDNPGLLVGDREGEISRIYLALDADERAIAEAALCDAQLLLTHHPLIFSPLKRITTDDLIGSRVVRLLQSRISHVAMHTNYDAARMGGLAADRLHIPIEAPLGDLFEREEKTFGIGTIGNLPERILLRQLAEQVKESFSLGSVRVFGDLDREIGRVAICPGAGKSMIKDALQQHAEVYITGDIDHHSGIDAVSEGLCIIDAGHYGIEHIFVEDMQECLHRLLPQIEVVAQTRLDPFVVV